MSKSKTKSKKKTDAANPSETAEPQFRHLVPVDQPDSVHLISEALYRPFTEGGSTGVKFRITGCSIDPVPFVQMASGEYRLLNGQAVSPEHANSLGLENLDQMEEPPAVWKSSSKRERYLQNLDKIRCQERLADSADRRQWIVWCNHFHGTLAAESAEFATAVEIPFSMWGSRLVNGLDNCPPLQCELNQVETYRLAVDEEGSITDADQILMCGETKRRLSKSKLHKCHSTGQLVDPDSLTLCPIRDHQFLERTKVVCQGCYQAVDPGTITKETCESCRGLKKVSSADFLADQRLSNLIEKHAWLKESRKVKISRQPNHWLLQFQADASGRTTWRMLFERPSGVVCQVARSAGWLRGWELVPQTSWPDFVSQ